MKQNRFRVQMSLWLTLLLSPNSQAQTNDVPKPTAGEILIVSNSPIEAPDAPMELLIAALKSHPTARRFRITWDYNAFNFFSQETAIYDRKAGRLALFFTDNNNEHSHLLFTGVKESIFPKILPRHFGNYQGNVWGYFDDLDKYGCRRYDLTTRPQKVPRKRRR